MLVTVAKSCMLHGNSLQYEIILDSMKFLIMPKFNSNSSEFLLNFGIKKKFISSKKKFHVLDVFHATNNHLRNKKNGIKVVLNCPIVKIIKIRGEKWEFH